MECFAMKEFQPIKEGKVREIYDNGDSLIMVATDRISAFDVILKNKVTNKGVFVHNQRQITFFLREFWKRLMIQIIIGNLIDL